MKIGALEGFCKDLMNGQDKPPIAPFAPQAFYPHFLNYNLPEESALGRSCAFTYLKACDEVYVLGEEIRGDEKVADEPEVRIAKAEGLLITRSDHGPVTCPEWRAFNWTSNGNLRSKNLFREDLKRVYVCTPLREKTNGKLNLKTMGENIGKTLWICRQLVLDEDNVAPIAPHAFYPYFWRFVNKGEQEGDKYKLWFACSKAILKICDAVYVYSEYKSDGCPKMSEGMEAIVEEAKELGLEIQYRTLPNDIPGDWNPDSPRFEC